MADADADTPAGFKPYIPADQHPVELTFRAALIGSLLGILFGASSVYLALKVGLTVSASIPIAVLSIPIFRALGKGSILENNMTQTVGSAGESIAAGVVFTVPALIILGYDLEISTTSMIALTGGWLGVLLMIPLRKSLIVKEHGVLMYPEGTACAEVLEAGERRGVQAVLVFVGLAVGLCYKFLYKALYLWKEAPERALSWYKGASVGVEASPELLGVGYIIGPRIAAVMVGGGVLSFLVLIPMIRFFGEQLGTPLYPGTVPISEMSNYGIRSAYVAYIGAGAVAAGGIMSLARAMPTIVRAFAEGVKGFREAGKGVGVVPRTEQDLPLMVTAIGAVVLAIVIALLPGLHVHPITAVLMVIFGFFFATVSSRICGQIGSSSNPVSGMTIATILFTCLLFVAMGWTGAEHRPLALMVGAIVCIAAANAGATSQDLKTGFLVGATPRKQQLGLLIGVTTSAVAVGWTLIFINETFSTTVWKGDDYARYRMTVPSKVSTRKGPDGKPYAVVRLRDPDERARVPAGTYLYASDGKLAFVMDEVQAVRDGATYRAEVKGAPAQVGPDGKTYVLIDVKTRPTAVGVGLYGVDAAGRLVRKQALGLGAWQDVAAHYAHYRLPAGQGGRSGETIDHGGDKLALVRLAVSDSSASIAPGEYLADAEGHLVYRVGASEGAASFFVPLAAGATLPAGVTPSAATQVGPDGARYRVASAGARTFLSDDAGAPRFELTPAPSDRIFRPVDKPAYRAAPSAGGPTQVGPDGKLYQVLALAKPDNSGVIPPGKYLVDSDGRIAFVEDPGVAGREEYKVDKLGRPVLDPESGKPIHATKMAAPKAALMAVIIDGLLTHKLPWALVLFGVFIAIVLSLSGVEALAFAVGLYLPLISSTPIFAGGVVRWAAERKRKREGATAEEGDTGRGVLFASGLIAGGTLCGLLAAGLAAGLGEDGLSVPRLLGLEGTEAARILDSNWLSTVLFCLLAVVLYRVARRKE